MELEFQQCIQSLNITNLEEQNEIKNLFDRLSDYTQIINGNYKKYYASRPLYPIAVCDKEVLRPINILELGLNYALLIDNFEMYCYLCKIASYALFDNPVSLYRYPVRFKKLKYINRLKQTKIKLNSTIYLENYFDSSQEVFHFIYLELNIHPTKLVYDQFIKNSKLIDLQFYHGCVSEPEIIENVSELKIVERGSSQVMSRDGMYHYSIRLKPNNEIKIINYKIINSSNVGIIPITESKFNFSILLQNYDDLDNLINKVKENKIQLELTYCNRVVPKSIEKYVSIQKRFLLCPSFN